MRKRIECDDFLKNHVLTNLKMNGKKTRGLYFVNTLNLEANCYEKHVYVFELEGLKTRHLILSIEPDDFEFFGDKVIFKVWKEEHTELYHYDFHTKEIHPYAKIPYKVEKFSICGENIYFTVTVKKNSSENYIHSGEKLPFYEEGVGFSAQSRTSLLKFNNKDSQISILTDSNIHIDDIVFDFENNRIVFTAFEGGNIKSIASNVYTFDLTCESIRRWTNGTYRISYVDVLSSQELIFSGVDLRNKSRNDNGQLYFINTSTGCCKPLGRPLHKSNEMPGVVSDSRFSISRPVMTQKEHFYFLTVDRYGVTLNKIGRKGNLTSFKTGLTTIDSYGILKEGMVLIGLKGLGLHEIYYFKDDKLSQVTAYNDWLLKERHLSVPEYMKVYNYGIDIDGWVIPPLGIKPGKKYPGVLMIHGGPKLIYSHVYHHDMQLLSANGYYVFYANPKGSDGRGDDFSNIRGSYGTRAYKELMTFTDEVISKYPQIDKDALGVTGPSYGGYMTNYIITRTDRFKGAVPESGISNLITAFTSSDIGYKYIFEYMGNKNTPWNNSEVYIEQSPIMKANNVKTPTLFIHGKEDYRCNYTESLNMYSALKYHGVDTKLCVFEKENHNLNVRGRPKSKKIRHEEMLNWFNRYLKKEKI
ncbi:alpha/beta hydrolase family protein [Anaeromicrobium sediminis]|uniref:Peptidase S9 prolyl oligopeptidase catalytic domain-containing protein n=1 Tax=Anaeromicrobium sediminis TaxID=1478221 RepID=A0A267ML02_9FIRM|nr:S9 family peptidase [Anaeromicrobium sediminis]PAB60271.1 hypothetical protein CCE28_05055 [Anaeromicrobium sediminis]